MHGFNKQSNGDLNFFYRMTSRRLSSGSCSKENTWVNLNPVHPDKWLNIRAWFDSKWVKCQPKFSVESNANVVVTLILSGEMCSICSDGTRNYCKAGELVILHKRDNQQCMRRSQDSPGKPLVRLGLVISGSSALYALLKLFSESGDGIIIVRCSEPEVIKKYMLAMKEVITCGSGTSFELENLLFHLLEEALRQANTGDMPDALRKVMEFILTHGYKQLTVTNMAHAGNTSLRTLSRLFRAQFGISPGEYLYRRRLEYAKALLQCHKQLISEVALMCGFKSVEAFNHMFKKRTGKTPREYHGLWGCKIIT